MDMMTRTASQNDNEGLRRKQSDGGDAEVLSIFFLLNKKHY